MSGTAEGPLETLLWVAWQNSRRCPQSSNLPNAGRLQPVGGWQMFNNKVSGEIKSSYKAIGHCSGVNTNTRLQAITVKSLNVELERDVHQGHL